MAGKHTTFMKRVSFESDYNNGTLPEILSRLIAENDSKTTINLVKKDGSDPKALFDGVSLVPGETLEVADGAEGLLRDVEDSRYAHASAGLKTGLKAKLIIEYI